MTSVTIALDEPLALPFAEEFGKRIYFAAGDVLDFAFVRQDDMVTAVELQLAGAADAAQVTRKLKAVLDEDVRTQILRPPKEIWTSPHQRPPAGDIFAELAQAGEAFAVAPGQVALGPRMLRLADILDTNVRDIVTGRFGGREFRYPTLIPADAMHRCGYLTSFPQYMMFVTRLHSDIDGYRRFVADTRQAHGVVDDILSRCVGVDYCLPPTMCYHTFNQYADGVLPADVGVVTARGKSFRHEEKYQRGLERLWDFTIREVVFFGDREHVLAQRREFIERILRLVEELGLSGRCEVANDPFFGSADVAVRSSSQRLLELKYELRLDIDGGKDVAVASFNFHERTFGEAFDIRLPNGEKVFTACAGFGLERLAYAIACQYAIDPSGWPERIRSLA